MRKSSEHGRRRPASLALGAVLTAVTALLAAAAAGAASAAVPPAGADAGAAGGPPLSVVVQQRLEGTSSFDVRPVAARVGQTVEYELVVTNSGAAPLVITLSDPACDPGSIGIRGVVRRLYRGRSTTFACSHLLAPGESGALVNRARVSGAAPDGTSVAPAAGRAVATIAPPPAQLPARVGTHAARSTGTFFQAADAVRPAASAPAGG